MKKECPLCMKKYTPDEERITSNDMPVCSTCLEGYEEHLLKYNLIDEVKKNTILSFIRSEILDSAAVTNESQDRVRQTFDKYKLDEFLYAIKCIPVKLRKQVYAFWLTKLIEENYTEIDFRKLTEIIGSLVLKPEDFNEQFTEHYFWEELLKAEEVYKKVFVETIIESSIYKYATDWEETG